MWKRSKVTDPAANGQAGIRKRSKTPGVMITQFVMEIPRGKSTPDFQRKPISLTIQEGKVAVFKAVVKGDPKPQVTWTRAKGDLTDTEKCMRKYNESSGEHSLEIHEVSPEDADTYKCFAVNEYGKAVCTVMLNVIEVGFKKHKAMEEMDIAATDPSKFRKLLRKSIEENHTRKEEGEIDERFWEVIMNADRKDYERICAEFGVKDFRLILKKLGEKKQQRVEEQYRDGAMAPCNDDSSWKHSFKQVEKKTEPMLERAGLYQVDREEVNAFTTDFRVPNVDFLVKIQEAKAQEREDALFECVLTQPLPCIRWMAKNSPLEDGGKYNITVSEDKLIHRLLIRDCKQVDKGIYAAVAGNKSCSAWLVVEADGDPKTAGKKKARKMTWAGGAGIDLEKVAREQQMKLQEERERTDAALKAKAESERLKDAERRGTYCGEGEIMAVGGLNKGTNGGKVKSGASEYDVMSEKREGRQVAINDSGCVTMGEVELLEDVRGRKPTRTGQKASYVKDSNEARHRDGREDSAKSAESSRHTRQDQQTQGVVIDLNVPSDCDGKEDSNDPTKHAHFTKEDQHQRNGFLNDGADPSAQSECGGIEDDVGYATHSKPKRHGPLVEDLPIDPGVQFISGLSDVNAVIGETAEIMCKLSSEDCGGSWFRDGKKLLADGDFVMTKEGATHKLLISSCKEEHAGKYRFEADGRKTEAVINVKDPPRFNPDDLSAFIKPVTVKVGQNAIFKLPFVGLEPMKIQWYREGEELFDDSNIKIEKTTGHSRLLLSKCQRRNTGEIKIKLKNEHGFTEAFSQLVVLDKPTSPLGPAEIVESSASYIEFKWRPPKDDGGSPVINYILERQQVGRNTWKKIGETPDVPRYCDTEVDHGRRYCYRIRAVNAEGVSEMMETEDIQAGTLVFPGSPAPPKVVGASKDCISLSWSPPVNTGGSRVLGYHLEKRKKGSNLWTSVNPTGELINEKKYSAKDIMEGIEYEFRVAAINTSGAGEFSNPSEFVVARDPKKPPGIVRDLKVTDTSYTHLSLAWTKPEDKPGIQDEAKGYFVDVRLAECSEWCRCNVSPIIVTFFSVKGLKSMGMYWVRVTATNEGGDSSPVELDNYVLVIPSPVRPRFTDRKKKSFMVVRAGNSVRITVNFEASPRPDVIWQKDNVPVTKRVTISNSDSSSQLLIPSSERSDSGIYSILVKNIAGQEMFSVEVRVTDEPKPPGPVELEENVPGTVTVIWEPSPDEKRDDRLHYTVSKLDSTKRTWSTVADRLFNNKFTVCNIMQGREYHFRVYAKNDMGLSAPSESPTWGMEKKKEKFVVNIPTKKDCDLRCAPTFLVPLKLHTAPKGYECYMSCAVKGNPKPHITWYHNNISLNTNTNYYISNICGVCSMLILRVGPKDMGEYSVMAENALGRAECSTILSVRE